VAIKTKKAGQPKKYDKLYSEDIKNEFINTRNVSSDSRKRYESNLRTIGEFEYLWEKDLYNFSIDEIQLFLSQKGGTSAAINSWGSLIATYLKWAKGKGYSDVNEQLLERMNKEFYDSFATPFFFTDKDIEDLVKNHCNNLEDKIIILLLFEGLSTEEICLLKYSDIQSRNFSEQLIELINKFKDETEFESTHGTRQYLSNQQGYIIKKVNTNPNEEENSTEGKIYTSLNRIVKGSRNKLKGKLTPKTLNRSGILYYAMLLYKEEGKLGNEQYDKIFKRFNIKKVLNSGILTTPYFKYRTQYMINEDTIKLYYFNINLEENQIQSNPLWKIKEQNGLAGEKVVWRYLEKEHPKCHLYKPADKEGYDIEVYKNGRLKKEKETIKRVEVKTVQKNGRTIYLTSNELEKAKGYGDEYYIYLVNNLIDKYEIYIIQNPINTFNINLDKIESEEKSSFCSINVSSIKLKLNDEFFEINKPVIVRKNDI
jgi:integrase